MNKKIEEAIPIVSLIVVTILTISLMLYISGLLR